MKLSKSMKRNQVMSEWRRTYLYRTKSYFKKQFKNQFVAGHWF